jgi:hypothetical protein
VMKPKPLESLNHFTLPVSFIAKTSTIMVRNFPAQKAGAKQSVKKKSART